MKARAHRWTALLLVGLVSGLIQVASGVTMYLAGVYFTVWSIRLSLVLLLLSLVLGIRWYVRHALGGRTTYVRALGVGVGMAVITALTYATYNVITVSFVYSDFLGEMVRAEVAQQLVQGLDPGRASQMFDSLQAERTLGNLVIGNFLALCRFGIVLSLVVAIGFRGKTKARRPAVVETP